MAARSQRHTRVRLRRVLGARLSRLARSPATWTRRAGGCTTSMIAGPASRYQAGSIGDRYGGELPLLDDDTRVPYPPGTSGACKGSAAWPAEGRCPAQDVGEGSQTTLMIQRISPGRGEEDVRDALGEWGFGDACDVVYVPMNRKRTANLGYAFVNFKTAGSALDCLRALGGQTLGSLTNHRPCRVAFSKMQGAEFLRKRSDDKLREAQREYSDAIREGLARMDAAAFFSTDGLPTLVRPLAGWEACISL